MQSHIFLKFPFNCSQLISTTPFINLRHNLNYYLSKQFSGFFLSLFQFIPGLFKFIPVCPTLSQFVPVYPGFIPVYPHFFGINWVKGPGSLSQPTLQPSSRRDGYRRQEVTHRVTNLECRSESKSFCTLQDGFPQKLRETIQRAQTGCNVVTGLEFHYETTIPKKFFFLS